MSEVFECEMAAVRVVFFEFVVGCVDLSGCARWVKGGRPEGCCVFLGDIGGILW